MKRLLSLFLIVLMPSFASAQSDDSSFAFGGDIFAGGDQVTLSEPIGGDAMLGGQHLSIATSVPGTVHAIGQNVTISAPVGGNVYTAGQNVTIGAAVEGNVTAIGQSIDIGDVGLNLRATGQTVTLGGTISGSALVAADKVNLNGPVAGDVSLNAGDIIFGSGASVGGTLTLYSNNPGQFDVPASVASADQIVRKTVEEWDTDTPVALPVSRGTVWRGFVSSVITVTVLAAILAALMPGKLANMRGTLLGSPARSLWMGFLTLSALIGAVVVLAMTVIGLLGAPVVIILAILGAMLGYIVGAYALGVGLIKLIGRDVPDSWIERAVAAGIGAVVIAVIGLIPFVGWIAALALTLTGLGAFTITLLRPRFFVSV